nr:hypothetical protein [uncultured Cohaesibacter sp.]
MEKLHTCIMKLLPNGWETVKFYGKVSMFEVSVDIPKIDIGSFHVLPQQVTSVQTWGKGGKLETLYLGKRTGNQTRIYDRWAKRKNKNQFSKEFEGTRIERIQRSLKKPLSDLPTIANPFTSLQLVISDPPSPEFEPKPYIWELFMDSVSRRSLPAALKILPIEKRTKYRSWLKEHPVDWWNPEQIWGHWPSYLDEIGILNVHHLKKE